MSSAAKDLLERGVREEERKLPDVLETNWSDLMEIEFKKKIFVNVPVNFEAPDGLKMAKNDMLSEIFEFVWFFSDAMILGNVWLGWRPCTRLYVHLIRQYSAQRFVIIPTAAACKWLLLSIRNVWNLLIFHFISV